MNQVQRQVNGENKKDLPHDNVLYKPLET